MVKILFRDLYLYALFSSRLLQTWGERAQEDVIYQLLSVLRVWHDWMVLLRVTGLVKRDQS